MRNQSITKLFRHIIYCFLCVSVIAFANPSFADNDKDPWEGFNRGVFRFNDTVDRYALKPVTKAYRYITPDLVQTGVSNVFDNLEESKNMVNNVLQLKFRDAGKDFARFMFNSTFGILGVFDVATKMGLERSEQDFGLTLAHWGVPSGPYVVLPFFGPSTVRDTPAKAVDFFTVVDPFPNDTGARWALTGAGIIDARSRLMSLEKVIVGDPYIFIRNAYLENREMAVKGYVEDDF